MLTVSYGDGPQVEVEPGSSVLEASRAGGVSHASACGGRGRCTTCRVRVEDGLEHCPEPASLESEALAVNGLEPPIRLACQLRPTGNVRVRVLLAEHRAPERDGDVCEEQIAVLFTDLRGFSRFAERNLPFDVATVLNRYFDTAGVQVERHQGHILDYLGDGMMALFRPIEGAASPERRALQSALDTRERGVSFSRYVKRHFDGELAIGAAVHCGRAVVGNLGFFRDRHLNAVGDVLNVAARLEDLNSELGTDLLISEPALGECSDLVDLGRSFATRVRGRDTPLTAYEVLNSKQTKSR